LLIALFYLIFDKYIGIGWCLAGVGVEFLILIVLLTVYYIASIALPNNGGVSCLTAWRFPLSRQAVFFKIKNKDGDRHHFVVTDTGHRACITKF
jgi:putative flippase GtrA